MTKQSYIALIMHRVTFICDPYYPHTNLPNAIWNTFDVYNIATEYYLTQFGGFCVLDLDGCK